MSSNETFQIRHMPRTVNDLVFHDQSVEQVIRDYVNGNRTKHLLLHGPVGTGKSVACDMILKARLGDNIKGKKHDQWNGRVDKHHKNWEGLRDLYKYVRYDGVEHPYAHLDEVDRFGPFLVDQLDEFLETDKRVTLLMTTNNIHELEDWFRSRCLVVEVLPPTREQILPLAKKIFAREGFLLTDDEVEISLRNFAMDMRKFLEWMQRQVLELQKQKASMPASAAVAKHAHDGVPEAPRPTKSASVKSASDLERLSLDELQEHFNKPMNARFK